MSLFTGYLDRWSIDGAFLELRLSSGSYWPDSTENQILYVRVEKPEGLPDIENRLSHIEPYETELYVEEAAPTELTIHLEYEKPLMLRGARVSVRLTDLELPDYKRFAKDQHRHLTSLNDSLRETMLKICAAKELLTEQTRRLSIKAEGHAEGSTVRTLYDQQLSFIRRVLSKLDA